MASVRNRRHIGFIASPGMKINEPVAVLAVSKPMIKPRRVANQRLTMVAPKTTVTQPEATPDNTPQVATKCHGSVIQALAPVEAAMSNKAQTNTRRVPNVCISAAANGPTMP